MTKTKETIYTTEPNNFSHNCTESDILLTIHFLNEYYKGHNLSEKIITEDAAWNIIESFKQEGLIDE